ncbi:hypothetical protein [Alcaligenes sp. WGS1538]|uniref:hypothetical protein n=1 Tax=Alcaligenes sp. WGS1538 TaxID=3366811 RepID=UPI00372D29A0
MLALPELGHFLSVFGDEDVESLFGQITTQEVAQSWIVVDDKDFAGEGGGLRVHSENVTGIRKRVQGAVEKYYTLSVLYDLRAFQPFYSLRERGPKGSSALFGRASLAAKTALRDMRVEMVRPGPGAGAEPAAHLPVLKLK